MELGAAKMQKGKIRVCRKGGERMERLPGISEKVSAQIQGGYMKVLRKAVLESSKEGETEFQLYQVSDLWSWQNHLLEPQFTLLAFLTAGKTLLTCPGN